MVLGTLLVAAGTGADQRPYAVLTVWFAVGCLYWVVRGDRVSRSMRTRRMKDELR